MTIVVRRATVADAPAFARTMSDAAVYPGVLQVPFTDAEFWRARLTDMLAPGKPDLLLVAELDGDVVGNAGLSPASSALRRRHAMYLGMAIALYRKFGFELEGTLRAFALRDGSFVDAHAMARLHPRPPRLPGA